MNSYDTTTGTTRRFRIAVVALAAAASSVVLAVPATAIPEPGAEPPATALSANRPESPDRAIVGHERLPLLTATNPTTR